jgi:hypothetical protein
MLEVIDSGGTFYAIVSTKHNGKFSYIAGSTNRDEAVYSALEHVAKLGNRALAWYHAAALPDNMRKFLRSMIDRLEAEENSIDVKFEVEVAR